MNIPCVCGDFIWNSYLLTPRLFFYKITMNITIGGHNAIKIKNLYNVISYI